MNRTLFFSLLIFGCLGTATAGVVDSLQARWDAAPRTINGNERSLSGGIRYSVSGGSYEAFRDAFSWSVVPDVIEFQSTVENAFAAWTAVDPVSGLRTDLAFLPDFATPVITGTAFGRLDPDGAEIDLVASNAGQSGFRALTAVSRFGTPVTLTSGVANYQPSVSIDGVDLHMNNHPDTAYTLDIFRRLLTHEIGHAIGLGDVDLGEPFLDDNYDPNDPFGTLTNSWALLVDPLDPANSAGLIEFSVPPSDLQIAGVDILMESNGLGISADNPLSELFPLRNDDYAMRQYLYPVTAVPEPGTWLCGGLMTALLIRRRSSSRRKRCVPEADPVGPPHPEKRRIPSPSSYGTHKPT